MPLSPPKSGGGASSRSDNALTGLGIDAQTADIRSYTNAVAPNAGTLAASLIGLNGGDQITNIITCITVGGSGAAPTLIRVGIWDKNFNLLASSVDSHASAIWTVQGYAIAPLSAIFTVPLDGAYFAGFLKVGTFATTQPTFVSGTTQTNAGKPVTGATRIWWEQTGLADLPNPAVPGNPTNAPQWFGVS